MIIFHSPECRLQTSNMNTTSSMSFICFLLWISGRSGIGMLTFALLMSARMGIFQETLYKQYGKHSKEALFYNVSFLSPRARFNRLRE